MHRTITTTLSIGLIAAAAGSLVGCVGYASYPPIDSASPVVNNPNAPPADELMMLGTKWVADRYPPPHAGPVVAGEPQFAINLPEGVRRDVYERVSQRTGGRAVPLTEENAKTLPIYSISRIWIRMHDAKIDIMRPRLELPKQSDGQPVYECITLLVEGGMQPWRVTRFQTWEVGIVPPPPLWYCPEDYGPVYAMSGQYRPPVAPKPTTTATAPEENGVDSRGVPVPRPVEEAPPIKNDSDN